MSETSGPGRTLTGALSAAIANLPCSCTDDGTCGLHRLLEPEVLGDANAGDVWPTVGPLADDVDGETWTVQIVHGRVMLDGNTIPARDLGLALIAAAEHCEVTQ